MATSVKLGGFKVLKDIVWFEFVSLKEGKKKTSFPAEFCRIIARDRINLLYFTSLPDDRSWGLSFAVESSLEGNILTLVERSFGIPLNRKCESVILSIFPHKGDPRITGLLLNALAAQGLEPGALANSPAAVSVVLDKRSLNRASNALFGPFKFSAYRTPDDWKLAQKGKETLYKEVVATYQERRPKVYGLRYRENQELLHFGFNRGEIQQFGGLLNEFGRVGAFLSFIGTGPCIGKGRENIVFCLSRSGNKSLRRIIRRCMPGMQTETSFPVTAFSMTGPHFGDRYGIACDLLSCLERAEVEVLGLNCSIASIKGVVSSDQTTRAIEAIQSCFEVPALIQKK